MLMSEGYFDDIMGQTYSIYIITIAGAESAIGLGILVAYYRLRGVIASRDADEGCAPISVRRLKKLRESMPMRW